MLNYMSVALALIICAPLGLAQREIPDDNLAYPVLISQTDCADGVVSIQGTGFFINTESSAYLVTARHVLFNESPKPLPSQPNQPRPRTLWCKKAESHSFSRKPEEAQLNRFSIDLEMLNNAGMVKAHATHDVAVVKIGVIATAAVPASAVPTATTPPVVVTTAPKQMTAVAGVILIQKSPSGMLGADLDTLVKFEQVLTANDIYVLGYPESIGLQQAPQVDYTTPLLRKGIIAGTNSANKTIVLDCMTFLRQQRRTCSGSNSPRIREPIPHSWRDKPVCACRRNLGQHRSKLREYAAIQLRLFYR
jgi:hypothetical protein